MNRCTPPGCSRRSGLALMLAVPALLAACATPPGTSAPAGASGYWTGRLGLQVQSEPPEQFFAAFELSGNAQAGRLSLATPLGSTLAVLEWQPGAAILREGNRARHFDSIEQLAAVATGTELPVQRLFAWLDGVAEPAGGWQPDLSRLDQGRITAQRTTPPPSARLRIVLDTN